MALATTAVTLYVIYRFSGGYRMFWALAKHISFTYWVLLIVLTSLFYLMDYARYYTLFAVCGEKLPLSLGLQLTCVSYFVSTMTPGAELYVPAVVFLVRRRGISGAHGAAVAMIKPFYLTASVCLIAFASLRLNAQVHLPIYVANNLGVGMLPFTFLTLTFAYLIFYPDRILGWTSRRASNSTTTVWEKKVLAVLAHGAEAISAIGKSTQPMHLLAHVASVLFILAYSAVGWALSSAVGMSLSPGKALTVFSSSLMTCYLSPVPAGMGITEVTTSYLLDPTLSHSAMVISALLRFLCWYIVVLPGAVLLSLALELEGLKRFFKEGIIPSS
jgi:uncharacterized protein (TIRG00374 family)